VPPQAPAPLALVGPTASGKSGLAMALAEELGDVEIVSVDSMQVYRDMDIGTAKPTAAEQQAVRHHLIDVLDPWEEFDVARFQRLARTALDDIAGRGRRALLVGGSGLYHRAVVDDLRIPGQYPEVRAELEAEPSTTALHERLAALDPVAAGRMEPTNRRRVLRALEVTLGRGEPFSSSGPGLDAYPPSGIRQIGLEVEAPVLAERIAGRYRAQLAAGFVDEVRTLVDALAAAGRTFSRTAEPALGYRELAAHLRGEESLEDAVEHAVVRTRQFARRQRSWFRRDPRVTWLPTGLTPDTDQLVDAVLADL
jgi:tRNA dimethylallyltransferase